MQIHRIKQIICGAIIMQSLGIKVHSNKYRKRRMVDNIALPIYYFLMFCYLELLLKIFTKMGNLFYPVLFAVPFALLCSILSSLSRSEKVNRIITIVISSVVTLLFLVQHMYYYIFKTFMQMYSVTVGVTQAMGFQSTIISAIGRNILKIALYLIPLILIIVLGNRYIYFDRRDSRVQIMNAIVMAVIYIFGLLFMNVGRSGLYSAYDLYYRTNSIDLSVQKMGLLTSTRLDVKRLMFGFEEKLNFENKKDTDLEDSESSDTEDNESEAEKPKETGPNVLELNFDKLMEESTSENITNLHSYFKSATPTEKNEYTGMFEGYNLIMLTAEGFSHMAVHETLTPTLYKLVNNGVVFEDFYTPIWGVSTSDGEYVACTGLVPKEGVWSLYTSGEQGNDMRFCMGRQFEALGYKTFAYHDHTFDYYGRDVSHPNMGYIYKGLGNGLEVEETWPESDLEMMEKTVDDWINEENFHAYYMTVSGHMNYSFSDNMMSYKNREAVADLDMSDEAKAYLACNIELDKALEYLINRLSEVGKLDNTVFMLSADHYPYGLEKSTINELSGYDVEENFELYRNAGIIWNSSMDKIVVSKPVCSMDLIPTISNLFGLPYDSRMLAGTDALSESDPLIVFKDASFIKGNLKYVSGEGIFEKPEGAEYTDEEIDALKAEVSNKFKISASILDNDYYSYLPKNE